MKKALILMVLAVSLLVASAQNDTTDRAGEQKIKTGWTFGALPTLAYDADMGFQYGGLVNLFNYGDGSTYPEYKHAFLLEISRFTGGSGVNQFFYDSKYLLPRNIRITADFSYLTEKALDFYGFDGYQSIYYRPFEEEDSGEYRSRMFYRQQRKLLRILTDFQGKLHGENWRWLLGFSHLGFDMGTVDIMEVNEGKEAADILPDTALLYDLYRDWALIPIEEAEGGNGNFLRLGIIYDSRDFEASPEKGLWTELLLMTAPRFLFNDDFAYTKLAFIHRQYQPVIPKRLTFAYRIGYQITIGGHTPYYLQTYMINSFSTTTKPDGLGGAKTLRGILRNRVVGDGILYGNFEFRLKFLKTTLLNQNIYLGLNTFVDAGTVTREIMEKIPWQIPRNHFFDPNAGSLHLSYGAGLRIGLNENFIIAVDYGIAADERDGSNGLYIGIGNLF